MGGGKGEGGSGEDSKMGGGIASVGMRSGEWEQPRSILKCGWCGIVVGYVDVLI